MKAMYEGYVYLMNDMELAEERWQRKCQRVYSSEKYSHPKTATNL